MNKTTAKSEPQISIADEPEITLSTVNRSSKAGTLVIEATDGNFFMGTDGPHQLNSTIGGTSAGTITFSETVDFSNNPFARGSNVDGYANQFGPFQTGSYSDQKTLVFPLSTAARPLSLTKSITMVHTAALQQSGANAGGHVSGYGMSGVLSRTNH